MKTVWLRHARATVGGLLTGLLLAGCGSASSIATSASGVHTAAAPSLTTAQAAAVVQAYEKQNNAVNAAADSKGLPNIEQGPLLTADQALMTISTNLKQNVPTITDTDTQYVIPAVTGYPRWFLAISERVIGGVPSSEPTYNIFVQDSPSAAFRAAYAQTPVDQESVGPFALDSAGAATPVDSGAGLLLTPSDLGRAITAHYVQGLRGKDAFSYSVPLDADLGTGYVEGVQVLKSRGVALSRTLQEEIPQSYVLRTADGGALAFTADVVTDELVSTGSKATASLGAGTNDAALAGKPQQGVTAKTITVDRLEMFMTYIPTKASGIQAKVLAYSETGVSVDY
jgi:hypothetical protein